MLTGKNKVGKSAYTNNYPKSRNFRHSPEIFIIDQTGSLLWGETPTLSVSQQTFARFAKKTLAGLSINVILTT
jgi:hypothetical protein